MMSQTDLNRRQYPRYQVKVSARISSLSPVRNQRTGTSQFQFTDEICSNVSLGGAFIQMNEPLDLGQRVVIELHLPTALPLETRARVTRNFTEGKPAQTGIGIVFEGTTPKQRALLETFLNPDANESIPSLDLGSLID